MTQACWYAIHFSGFHGPHAWIWTICASGSWWASNSAVFCNGYTHNYQPSIYKLLSNRSNCVYFLWVYTKYTQDRHKLTWPKLQVPQRTSSRPGSSMFLWWHVFIVPCVNWTQRIIHFQAGKRQKFGETSHGWLVGAFFSKKPWALRNEHVPILNEKMVVLGGSLGRYRSIEFTLGWT